MYENFAEFYDTLMMIDYDEWIDEVSANLWGKKGVDLACGTGKFTIGLIKKGFNVLGVDLSSQMLNYAAQNALSQGVKAEFVCKNMLDFTPFGKQDFCICMCDGINYISNPKPLFEKVYKYLNKNGIFIFDISSEYRIKNVLANKTFSESIDDVTYIWHNYLIGSRKLEMDLTFFAPDNDRYIKKEEKQVMYLHKEDNLKKLLTTIGFKIKTKGELPLKRKVNNSERIHFICEKVKE